MPARLVRFTSSQRESPVCLDRPSRPFRAPPAGAAPHPPGSRPRSSTGARARSQTHEGGRCLPMPSVTRTPSRVSTPTGCMRCLDVGDQMIGRDHQDDRLRIAPSRQTGGQRDYGERVPRLRLKRDLQVQPKVQRLVVDEEPRLRGRDHDRVGEEGAGPPCEGALETVTLRRGSGRAAWRIPSATWARAANRILHTG